MSKEKSILRSHAGFTLIELMITVAIIGILAAIAYPAYQSQVIDSRRADGQSALLQVMQAQERYYTENYTYTTDLDNSGDAGELGLSGSGGNVTSDGGYYEVSATACGSGIGSCVQLTATPQSPQDQDTECANLTLDSTGAKGISGTGTVADCW